jgi:pimeloyl-ACP methyl ester carboxylesterase
MPYAHHKGVRLYWEEYGEGDPILLIMGLSFTLDMWFRVTPVLARNYRVILFDNRGVGRSDVPPGRRYSIGVMAEDAMAVLEAAGVREPAFLLGASMGGMIAQELALRYPDRFRALLLGCTACGPFYRASWPNFERSPGFWNWVRLRGEARERALIRLLYADTTPRERIEEDIRIRAVRQPGFRPVLSQLAGILSWSSYRRLPALKLPTLVVHGDQDHILPATNGRMVARRIPEAEFVLIPDSGHMLVTDQPELSLGAVDRFLYEVRMREAGDGARLKK